MCIKEGSLWCVLQCKGSEHPQGTRTHAPVISILFLLDGFIPGPLQLNHPGSGEVIIPIGQQGDPAQEASL